MTKIILDRLDRIEGKMDSLVDAMIALARIEERQSNHIDGIQRMGVRLEALEVRVRDLENLWWRIAGAVTVIATVGATIIPVAVDKIAG